MYEFFVSRDFERCLDALDEQARKQIREKLVYLKKLENPLTHARPLKGYKDIFRFRSGTYRIVFQVKKRQIILLLVKDRKDVYRGL